MEENLDDDDGGGWGRPRQLPFPCPRPKVTDIIANPQSGQDQNDNKYSHNMDIDDGDVHALNNERRVTAPVDYPLPGYNESTPQGELICNYASRDGLNQNQIQQIKNHYTVWSNGDKPHLAKFTCIFSCPVTGEHFASGNWESEKGVSIACIIDGVWWYSRKKNAIDGAAARALDCFSLRRCIGTGRAKKYNSNCNFISILFRMVFTFL